MHRFYSEVGDVKVQEAVRVVGQNMYDTARMLCPVRTGYLWSTIFFQSTGKWQFRLSAAASYASYVEFGTSHMTGRHFLAHAVELHRDEMRFAVAQAISDAIYEVFG